MYPDVCADDVDAVQAAPVAAADDHVVRLAVGHGVHDEVEHGRVDEEDVVHREVVCLFDAQEAGAVALAVLVVLVSQTCTGMLGNVT